MVRCGVPMVDPFSFTGGVGKSGSRESEKYLNETPAPEGRFVQNGVIPSSQSYCRNDGLLGFYFHL